jgi:hypothetical protein
LSRALNDAVAFAVEERRTEWVNLAPIRVVEELEVAASPEAVFSVLADHAAWPAWFEGLRRVRLNGRDEGLGALRTVWFGAARLDEHIIVFEEPCRMTCAVIASNLPGVRALITDWRLAPIGSERTRLTVTVGFEPSGIIGRLPLVARWPIARATRGARGLKRIFP